MKTVALILCVAIVGTWADTLEHAHKQTLQEVRANCQADTATHVDDAIWKKVQNDEQVEFPSNWGAHILCLSKGTGLQNADGTLNKAAIRAKIAAATSDEDAINHTLNECAVEKSTPELTARHLFKCFHDEDKAGHAHQH